MVNRVYGRRALLNPPGVESVAAICAEVTLNDGYWSSQVVISDCSRVINLSFFGPNCTYDEHWADLEKVDTMIGCLREFRKGLVKGHRAATA